MAVRRTLRPLSSKANRLDFKDWIPKFWIRNIGAIRSDLMQSIEFSLSTCGLEFSNKFAAIISLTVFGLVGKLIKINYEASSRRSLGAVSCFV